MTAEEDGRDSTVLCREIVRDSSMIVQRRRVGGCKFRGYHEEGVDDDVEVESREWVTLVFVVPEADLHRHDDGRIEEQRRAAEERPCGRCAARKGSKDEKSVGRLARFYTWREYLA